MLTKTTLLTLYDTGELRWDDEGVPAEVEPWLYLLQEVAPWMEAHPERVDFNCVSHKTQCGTFRCLLGHYQWMRHGKDSYGGSGDFGYRPISTESAIFGETRHGTLAERRERIDRKVREMLA